MCPSDANAALAIEKPAEPRRALTAVRGIAAWWVVAYHFRETMPRSTPPAILHAVARGYLAVDLFFILSGYVIALNYGHCFANRLRMAEYARFLALRLSRIYPLHGVMLALFLLNPLATWLLSRQGSPGDLHPGYYLSSVLLVQSWGFGGGPFWNVPAWSISAEWLAYLLFPLAAPLLCAPGLRETATRLRSASCVGGLLLLLAFLVGLGPGTLDDAAPVSGLVRCLVEFSVGACLVRLCRLGPALQRTALAAAALGLAAFAVLPLPDYAIVPAAFTLLILALADERGRLAAALRHPALQWLGVVSYSTYLSHYFVKTWMKFVFDRPAVPHELLFPAYLLVVLLASGVLNNVVEMPAQRWCRRRLATAGAQVGLHRASEPSR